MFEGFFYNNVLRMSFYFLFLNSLKFFFFFLNLLQLYDLIQFFSTFRGLDMMYAQNIQIGATETFIHIIRISEVADRILIISL